MDTRYKITLSNKSLYKEIELNPNVSRLKVGTGIDCDIRLRKELFFDTVELEFVRNGEEWTVICSDNIYLSVGDVKKLVTKSLTHGEELMAKYQNSDSEIFSLFCSIDFDYIEKKYDLCIDISEKERVRFGGGSGCNIVLKSIYVGNDYFEIRYANESYYLKKDHSKYGVYLNGEKITEDRVLKENDFISLADYSFCFRNSKIYMTESKNIQINGLKACRVSESKSGHRYPVFNRSTRLKNVLSTEKIPILDPPAAPQKPRGNIVMQLMPAIAMLAVTIVLRGFMSSTGGMYVWISVISMGIGIITSIAGIVEERRKYKKETKERMDLYTKYIENKELHIKEIREKEAEELNHMFYSMECEIDLLENFAPELFDRDVSDKDFLEIRLGVGSNKSLRPVDFKKQEKFDGGDELSGMPETLAKRYKYIEHTPITLNLQEKNAVGFVGERENLYNTLKNITFDLAIRQYYSDVTLFYIMEEERQNQFSWLRLLPHLWNHSLELRNIVCDESSKNSLFEYLYKELSKREADKISYPQIVVFVFDDMGMKRHPIFRYVDHASSLGITFLFFAERREFLPNGCCSVVTIKDDKSGFVVEADDFSKTRDFTYTVITDQTAERLSYKLAPVYCEEVSLEGSLTKNITLYKMLHILNAEDIDLEKNWSESAVYQSMAAPLGVKAKSEIVYLDLNEKKHGPHGLVAGTTGSGKSEILQTYILSMAALFHPYEVGFVIIDFKGGGMVNQFKDLPHLIGAITNIDGREINRSLMSIKAELRKRQELFAKYEVNHIDAYIKLFKKGETAIPLPHLILIVDEFAELKMDQPEFMKELISAARIGRSLGVHLILATQKPSGVVDAQIWSNSKFKLCLKVQNKEDSNEVLKTPLAAEIKEPGRAYLQVGNNEIFELFQSAYSGASADADDTKSKSTFTINQLNLQGKRTPVYVRKIDKNREESETQLEAMVHYIADYCMKHSIERLPGICLPPLMETAEYTGAANTHDDVQTVIPLGIYDDPDNQIQNEAVLNLLEGNTIIIGSSQYGKTNVLQVILRGLSQQYSPNEVHIYILDFASMALKVFDAIHHVGGVVVASEDEKLKNFMRMIRVEMKSRKEIFSQMGITSFASYKEAGRKDIPHIVILVDNFIALKELYAEYEEDLLNICREGISVGISIVITSLQTNGISYKYMSNFSNRICLYCNQGDEYGTLFDKCRMEPKNVPGRGLISIHKTIYEFQTYLAFEGVKEIERVERIKSYIFDINETYPAVSARRIPEVPQLLEINDMRKLVSNLQLKDLQVPVGIDYDTVEVVSIDLSKALTVGITGREGYGKTNLAKLFMAHLQNKVFDTPSKIYILDDYEKQFESVSDYGIVEKYTIDINEFEEMLMEVEEELQMRLSMVQSEGLEVLDEIPQIVFLIQNNDIYAADGISKHAVETYKRILKTYKNMKICFIFSNVDNVNIAYGSSEMTKQIKEYNYLFLLDDLANMKLIDINAATLRQYKKMIELGDAYLITEKGVQKQKTVHIKGGGIGS